MVACNVNSVANKRIPVTEGIWESLCSLKRPGQTYDDLLADLIALKQEHDFIIHIEKIEKRGDFMTLQEVAAELKIVEKTMKN
jgi:hypothetical protein